MLRNSPRIYGKYQECTKTAIVIGRQTGMQRSVKINDTINGQCWHSYPQEDAINRNAHSFRFIRQVAAPERTCTNPDVIRTHNKSPDLNMARNKLFGSRCI